MTRNLYYFKKERSDYFFRCGYSNFSTQKTGYNDSGYGVAESLKSSCNQISLKKIRMNYRNGHGDSHSEQTFISGIDSGRQHRQPMNWCRRCVLPGSNYMPPLIYYRMIRISCVSPLHTAFWVSGFFTVMRYLPIRWRPGSQTIHHHSRGIT